MCRRWGFGLIRARSLSLASLPPSPPPMLDRFRSGTGGLNSSRGTWWSVDPCRDSLFLGGRHSLPRSGLGFMGGLQRQWGPPLRGCRLGHMGLTGERGAQTEGKAATQHHCQITVDSFLPKHHSPREKTNRDRNRVEVGKKEGRGQRERSKKRGSVNIESGQSVRSWHQLLFRLSCPSGQTCKQTFSCVRQMERNQPLTPTTLKRLETLSFLIAVTN